MVTAAQRDKFNRDPISDAHILMCEIIEEHNEDTALLLCDNNEDIVSNSETYSKASLEFNVPGWGEEFRPPTLSVSNVERLPGRALLLSQHLICVRLFVIDASLPDVIIEGTDTLDSLLIESGEITSETLTLTLRHAWDFQHPVPFDITSEPFFPAIWA